MTHHKNNFFSPYQGTKKTTCLRYSCHLGRDSLEFLKKLDTDWHSLPTTISILVERLINELKRNGITQYDPEGYRTAVGGLTIILGTNDPGGTRSAAVVSAALESDSRHDGRGTSSISQSTSSASSVDAGVTTTPARKRKGRKAVGSEGETIGE